MKKSIFITGSSGFVGSNLLQRINPKDYKRIYCLDRTKNEIISRFSEYNNLKFIKGSVFDSKLYTRYLASSDIIIHLAAVTGKAKPEEYFNVNTNGTEFLVKLCEQHNVNNFIFISSIAVKFENISKYYYAQSKLSGEEVVSNSKINYSIVRPTIIIGDNSPIWKSFSKLASASIAPMFGDGKTKIQPIYIDDLVKVLLFLINEDNLKNETIELGGPEKITIKNFIKRIGKIYHKNNPTMLNIPIKPLISFLAILEKPFYAILPFTVGQLSSFQYDGTIDENRIIQKFLPEMITIDEMITKISTVAERQNKLRILDEECHVFSQYLINQPPNKYILKKYREGHETTNMTRNIKLDPFNKLLTKMVKINPLFLKLADTYSTIFHKNSIIKKKLVLMLAILESCSISFDHFDKADTYSKKVQYLKFFQKGLFFFFTLLFSMIILIPIQLLCTIALKKSGNYGIK